MKIRIPFLFFIFLLISSAFFISCKKQNLFRSESEVKKDLQGTWNLIAIPKYDTISTIPLQTVEHKENWTFSDSQIAINIESQTVSMTTTYSVNTSATKATLKIDGVSAPLFAARYNGTWQIVRLDEDFLAIANDKDGTSGLLQLEFQKKK